ncbi:flagellar motor protein MotB [Celerinatantimonas yamalensis]|uniref:Flagellar motor protein MotB n=1 Tax=Celerinatantimonas yamalensis TaxID=559956 RepID=A0ABW9GB00_9GAMM
MDEEEECKCPPGLPAWMATFSDLMSLLLCFFILLLSFSEMDVVKFKQIAGSMKYAFGVQNKLEVKDIPKGTSVIALDFRPGRPEPTPIETIMQQTSDMTQTELDFQKGENSQAGGEERTSGQQTGGSSTQASSRPVPQPSQPTAAQSEAARRIAVQLKTEIKEGALEVESLGQQIIIRIREKGSFPSGSAFLQPQFRPIIRKVASVIKDIPGQIVVSGNTDNQPPDSELYRSNWDLSAQRAVSVAQVMIQVPGFNQDRLVVRGLADTDPLVKNDTAEHRARNRRVEISIMQGKALQSRQIQVTPINDN